MFSIKRIKQLSVFLENKEGATAQVFNILKDAGISVSGASLSDTADYALMRMLVSDSQKAQQVLFANGINCVESVVVGYKLDSLEEVTVVLNELARKKFSINYMYITSLGSGNAHYMVFRLSDTDKFFEQAARAEIVVEDFN